MVSYISFLGYAVNRGSVHCCGFVWNVGSASMKRPLKNHRYQTVIELLNRVFYIRFAWLLLRESSVSDELIPCRGGFEYLHRSLASHRRQRKGKSRIWGSKIWSWVPRDLDPKMAVLARASSNCKRQTLSLVRESAPHQQTHKCLTVIKIWL
jgi:hypothetical protein